MLASFILCLNPLKNCKTNSPINQFRLGELMWHPLVRDLGIENAREMFDGFIASVLPIVEPKFKDFHLITTFKEMKAFFTTLGIKTPRNKKSHFHTGLPRWYIESVVRKVLKYKAGVKEEHRREAGKWLVSET